jgi:small subunit ribosomal protein S3
MKPPFWKKNNNTNIMGQKVNPIGFRLAVRRNWESRWYADKKNFPLFVKEDFRIREFLHEKLRQAAVPRIFIERASNRIRIKVFTARPGVVIGKRGTDLDKLRDDVQKLVGREVILDIQEVRKPDLVAQLVAENIALQLERRVSFRRAMKKAVQATMSVGADGIRLRLAGRLGGAEIARVEASRVGRVPLHTLRANIDYGFSEARTVYGKLGIKCWICAKETEF